MFIKKHIHSFLLLFLIIGIIISHILYVLKTYQFPHWDENVYMQYAIDYLPVLKHPTWHFWNDILSIAKHRQPIYPLLIAIPLLILGTLHAYKIALMLNVVFYAITILFTYLLARQFFSKLLSLLSSYMFAFYGFPLFYLHFTLEETCATSFVVIALFFLIKSVKHFSYKDIFFFSFFASIGTLVRWTTPIFLFGPVLFFIFMFFKKIIDGKIKKIHAIKTILIIFTIGILPTAIIYYLPNISLFLGYAEVNRISGSQWVPEAIRNPFSKSSVIWYASVLAQQTIFFWLLFIAGLFIASIHFRKYLFLLLAFVIPYLFFTLGAIWKEDRFIVQFYPIMAIISAICINEIKKSVFRKMLIFLILVIGFLNFLGATWGIGPMKFSINGNKSTLPNSIVLPMPIGHPRRIWLAPISWPPRENEGNAQLILESIMKDNHRPPKPTILLTFFVPQIEGPLYTTVLYQQRDLFNLHALWGFKANDYEILFDRIKNADYILIKNGGAFDDQSDDQPDLLQTFNETLRSSDGRLPIAFIKIREVDIPFDKSKVEIYKRAKEINSTDWEEFTSSFLPKRN